MLILQLRDGQPNNDAQNQGALFTSESCALQMVSHVQLFLSNCYHQELLPRKQNALTYHV